MNNLTPYIGQIINICKKLPVQKLHVFGSVLTNKFSEHSDIDFIVKIDQKIGFEKYSESYYILKEQLKNVFHRDIDIITEQSIKNPYLRKELDKTKQLIYEA